MLVSIIFIFQFDIVTETDKPECISRDSSLPECGTLLFSFSTDDYSKTYTMFECCAPGFITIFQMQDYPYDGPPTTTTILSQ